MCSCVLILLNPSLVRSMIAKSKYKKCALQFHTEKTEYKLTRLFLWMTCLFY